MTKPTRAEKREWKRLDREYAQMTPQEWATRWADRCACGRPRHTGACR